MTVISRIPNRADILSAKAATGTGKSFDVRAFKNVQLQVSTAGTSTLTVKIQASLSDVAPDFSAAASTTNPWDYVACYDLSAPSSIINGATGFATTGTDICKNVLVNIDGITWLNATVTAYIGGNATVTAVVFTNE
jgi:hypothetical protein